RLVVGRAVQVDVTAEGVHLAQAIAPRLAAAQPEDAREYPVAAGKPLAQLGGPDLPGPAPAAQHGAAGQPFADPGPHLMPAARRAVRAVAFARALERRGNRQAHQEPAIGETVEA